ncbi:hypothetical protein E8E13_008116 [Curvularia kusanoi]|uniref:Uncharacterized protein n=1 Tax=Curvularia kusanoi TaxID=90978 RepID=A0A9P4W6T4_CURKU|nr:hypothetical protein E8E13_008116 [Curvularia kusanoi]
MSHGPVPEPHGDPLAHHDLQEIYHTASEHSSWDIDTEKLLQEVKQSIIEDQVGVKAAQYLHKLQGYDQIHGSNFESKKAIEEA